MAKKIAIIPARGGSKRVKKKNLTKINNKPLIAYSIEVAQQSGMFDQIYVNSDDDDILRCAVAYGALKYQRPKELGGDKIFVINVIKEMIASLSLSSETDVIVLLPTCPLRASVDLIEGYKLFLLGRKDPVCSVTTYETPIHLGLTLDTDGRLSPLFSKDYKRSTRSTDHPTVYKFNEALIINTVEELLKQDNLIGKKPIPYVMPPERSITIDSPHEMRIVQLILSHPMKMENKNTKVFRELNGKS
ncbi:MAG: acylneuraminate cytidylyltransferase family protein [Bacteroidetes bacterium]|nr:acylneuraminate cytidylyltransferase family protein [Bacteroidota bacterium]